MKKIFATVLILVVLTLTAISSSATNDFVLPQVYETSTGAPCRLEDYDIYLDDFVGMEFNTSQEVVDHIYLVGNERITTRSGQINVFGTKLTVGELIILITHPRYVNKIAGSIGVVVTVTGALYPDNHEDGMLGNAFQHAYWTMYLCENTTPEIAIAFVTAHEEYDTNDQFHKTMDLYNNQAAYEYYVNNNVASLEYSNAEIALLIQDLMEDGSFIYIVEDYIYVAKSVYYMASGRWVDTYATIDGYAYSNSTIPYNVPETIYEVVPASPGGPVIRP